ncbi:MAG: sodium-dependent transporter [Lentisphaeria bacterium]|nr:sodium-dependent transporter [Lentisphaeria bacterium]
METREHWGSHWGFLLATAGAAIGLGNIWKFPYVTGMNGGAAFVLVYLLCVLTVGLPIMICELALGRATRRGAIGAFEFFTPKRSFALDAFAFFVIIVSCVITFFGQYGFAVLIAFCGVCMLLFKWKSLGIISGFIVPAVILSYYCVIGGWTLIYIVKAVTGGLTFTTQAGAEAVMKPILEAPKSAWGMIISAHLIFITITGSILLFGVKKGIERFSKFLMPFLFVLLVILLLRSITLPNASKGIRFFLYPDFSKLSAEGVLIAMGHAFFTLSLAMGITITYGSYLKKQTNLVKSSLTVILLDTSAAIMAGLAIFPAVFAMGFEPTRGPSLTFEILPAAFNLIPGGGIFWNTLFFLMLFIAALTSSMSLCEVVANTGIEQFKMPRKLAVGLTVFCCGLLGLLPALSIANWDNLPWLYDFFNASFPSVRGSMFDAMDSVCSDWLLPIGGLLITGYVGWIWGTRHALKEIRKGSSYHLDTNIFLLAAGLRGERGYNIHNQISTPAVLWAVFVRWVTPILLFFAFLYSIGLIKFQVPEVLAHNEKPAVVQQVQPPDFTEKGFVESVKK